ncbi:hypothetical protein Tco_0277285, partial [Tanacetum coccineum]
MDALALTLCYSKILITADVTEVYMYKFWDSIHKYKNSYRFRMDKKKKFNLNLEIFKDIFQICPRVRGQNFDALPTDEDIVSFFKELGHTGEIKTITDITTGLDKLRLSRAQILWGMYYKKNVDYVEILWEDFTYHIDNRASPEEPVRKSKRVKRPANNSSNAPTTGVVIRETPVKFLSKKKEKMTVEKRKGIDLLSKVALTKEAQYEEVQKKSLRDFHKTHPSGSSTVTKIAPSAAKIKPSFINEGTSGKDEDDNNNEHDSRSEGSDQEKDSGDDKAQSNSEKGMDSEHETDENESDETKIKDKTEGDEDEGMDYTTNQFNDDVNFRLNEPIALNQVIKDAHVTLSIVPQKTKVPVTSSSHSSDLASKFLNFSDIPHTDAEIVSPMDVHVHHISTKQANSHTPYTRNPLSTLPNFAFVFQFNYSVTALEKEVAKLKRNDPLNTQVTALVYENLDSRLGATRDEFMSYLLASITARITEQVKSQLSQILPKEVSNFVPPVIKSIVTELLEHVVLGKESSQPKSTYEAAATLTKFELKKILIDKINESQSYLTAAEHRECYDGLIKFYDLDKSLFLTYDKVQRNQSLRLQILICPQDQEENLGNDDKEPKGKTTQQGPTQSWVMTLASSFDKPSKTFDELKSTPIDFFAYIMNNLKITNLTQETLLGPAFKLLKGTHTNYAELEYDFEECYKALLEKLDWDNPKGDDYPFDLTKPLCLVMNGNRQMTKAAQYDLPGIEDMAQNIWSPVKVAYDKRARW